MLKYLLFLLIAFLCFKSNYGQIQSLELFSSDNTLATRADYQCFFANLNCSAFTNSVIRVDMNRPNFGNLVGQAAMFLSLTPYNSGCCAPFPDPNLPNSYTYTTFLANGTLLPNVQFKTTGAPVIYITTWCLTSQCEYNVVIGQTNSKQLTSKHDLKIALNDKSPNYDVKNLMLRNQITVDGVVNYNAYQTVTIPICGATLASIYGDSATVCFESTIFGKKLGYLFYQQITTINTYLPINFWYQRPPDKQEPIRDLTGAQKLPINRYRTLPIAIPILLNMTSVFHTVIGEGGEGEHSPQPNQYVATYEWFSCNS